MQWLLKKENVSFTTNEYSSEYEFDFIINNNILVECKMFKKWKDQEAIKSELENAIIQIINHLKSKNISYYIYSKEDNKLKRKVETSINIENELITKFYFAYFGGSVHA